MFQNVSEPSLGSTVRLDTRYGSFEACHLMAVDREGILMRPLGARGSAPVLRIQSSCVFSESLNTIDCDCALQLNASMKRVQLDGGVVLYLYEEGRGAGLKTKMEAIHLQQVHSIGSKEAYRKARARTRSARKLLFRTAGSRCVLRRTRLGVVVQQPLESEAVESRRRAHQPD